MADVVNRSPDRRVATAQAATEFLAEELARRGVYEVVPQAERERAARRRGVPPPLTLEALTDVARDLEAELIVSGEIQVAEARSREGRREAEVGLVVRVVDRMGGDLVAGAAERGQTHDAPGGSKTDGLLLLDAARAAAYRVAERLAEARPIHGTVLNSAGRGQVTLNRGAGHGVQKQQEFLVYRDGRRVGRLRVRRLFSNYAEMTIVDNSGGIQAQDHAVSVSLEPRLR